MLGKSRHGTSPPGCRTHLAHSLTAVFVPSPNCQMHLLQFVPFFDRRSKKWSTRLISSKNMPNGL